MKVFVRDLRIDGVTVHRNQDKESSIGIVAGMDDGRRTAIVNAIRKQKEVVFEIFGTLGCQNFDFIGALEKVLDEIESFGKAPWVNTIVMLDDVVTRESYDRIKMLFPEFELEPKEKSITIVSTRRQPIIWTTKSLRDKLSLVATVSPSA